MSPGDGGWLCLTLWPTSDHPKRTGDTSKPSKRLFGGSAAPARATSVGKMSRMLRKEVAFIRARSEDPRRVPPDPTCAPQPLARGDALMAGECFEGLWGGWPLPSTHPDSRALQKRLKLASSSDSVPENSHTSHPRRGCSPGAAGSAKDPLLPAPGKPRTRRAGARRAPGYPPQPPPSSPSVRPSPPAPGHTGKAAGHPAEKVLAQGLFTPMTADPVAPGKCGLAFAWRSTSRRGQNGK